MYQVKLFNKISKVGLERLDPEKYTCSEDAEQYDAVLVRSAKLHDTQFPQSLKCIARAGAGVNNIPLERCAEEGIVVFNTPGANANAVKELVICGLMLASRDIVGGIEWTKSLAGTPDIGPAAEKGKSKFAGPEVGGKRLGVIGLGAIGVQVANAAVGLDMEVWGYDPYLSVDGALRLSRSVKHITDVNEIFANCDYITVHVPLTPDTKHLIDADAIGKMKDGVRIINIARGELVDEDAMAAALSCGKVARYVSDFATDAMLAQKNAVIMPHLGASTPESEDNCAKMAAQEVREFLEMGTIRNSVNFPNLKVPYEGGHRLCLIHKNVPNMIAQITSTLSAQGMNIENMGNRSRGDYAYTIVDVNEAPNDSVLQAIRGVDGMIRVRAIENL
nr:phosphoglycerate dehydrogenase [uncultured Butyricicoccus sp.]